MGVIGNIIANVTGKGAADIVTSVGNVADKFITTGQEKAEFKAEVEKEVNRHIEAMNQTQVRELELLIGDTANARDREIKIATSEKAPLINKIILPIMAIFVTLGFFGILIYMMTHEVPQQNKDILNIMLGSLGTAWILIVGYYFGSSQASAKKTDVMIDQMKK